MKICGLTSEADAGLLIKYGADYGGVVVFYPKSKRDVTIKEAKIIVDILKKSDIKAVAVTVSPTVEQLYKIQEAGFDYIQIHGTLEKAVYEADTIPIIRAVNISDNNNADKTDDIINTVKEQVEECQKLDKVAGILLDWNSIKELEITEKKLFLAGGLNSGNVAAAVKCVQPDVVDISSGVEYEDVLIKGKDESKVKAFINTVNN